MPLHKQFLFLLALPVVHLVSAQQGDPQDNNKNSSIPLEIPQGSPEQDTKEDDANEARKLRVPSDSTSLQILRNNTVVIGAETGVNNITAEGTFQYADDPKNFKLVETADGKRWMQLTWQFMGRHYTETIVTILNPTDDSSPDAWRQITKRMPAKDGTYTNERIYLEIKRGQFIEQREQYGQTTVSYGTFLRSPELLPDENHVIRGKYAEMTSEHFKTVPLLLHSFMDEDQRSRGFSYIGQDKIADREAYWIRRGTRLDYYLDKEKFLLLQWGRKAIFGGKKLKVQYRTNAFKRWSGSGKPMLLPRKVSLIIKDAHVGVYTITGVNIDADIESSLFAPPG